MSIELTRPEVKWDLIGDRLMPFVDPITADLEVVFADDPEESWSFPDNSDVLREAIGAGLGLVVEN